ncbi:MAG: hypothetical protein DRJ63_06655 [Thermoprotei archaeon]|nr:MAG: hypothetical protein DRJ63_06655 [Thermoprotei archaeon]
MCLEDEEFMVLYAIFKTPSISVNQLYRRLRGRISKVKMIEVLKKLTEAGLVKRVRDPRHKQRIMLFLKDDVQRLARSIVEKTRETAKNSIVERADSLLRKYLIVASKISDPIVRDFLKRLVLAEIAEFLNTNNGLR